MTDYRFKTDRKKQWEEHKQGYEFSRKKIQELENYFFTGKVEKPEQFHYSSLLLSHPNQSIEHWQRVLSNWVKCPDESTGIESADDLFQKLQREFIGYISGFNFHPEDRAWIFKQIFGDSYDSGRLFPLVLPSETEKRRISFDADMIFRSLLGDISSYLSGSGGDGYATFLLGYMSSLMPHLTGVGFVLEKPVRKKNKIGNAIFLGINKVVLFSSQDLDIAEADEKIKIELALKVKEIFDDYSGELGEYKKLVELIEREGSQA